MKKKRKFSKQFSIVQSFIGVLALRGLELSKEKTHITNVHDGFDFLGFNFRKYANGKMIVHPIKEGIISFKSKIKEVFKQCRGSSLTFLINKLNPILRGWANYYKFVNSKDIFGSLDRYISYKSFNWIKRIHQGKYIAKYVKRYFKPYFDYKTKTLSDGIRRVFFLSSIPLLEHIKVRGEANPFDRKYDEYFRNRYLSQKLSQKI